MVKEENQVIRFNTTIRDMQRHKQLRKAWKEIPGDPSSVTHHEYEDLGWAVLLAGSKEWLFIGKDDPPADFQIGKNIIVTLEVTDVDR